MEAMKKYVNLDPEILIFKLLFLCRVEILVLFYISSPYHTPPVATRLSTEQLTLFLVLISFKLCLKLEDTPVPSAGE